MRIATFLPLLAAAVLVPASAASAAPQPDALFGGGTIGPGTKGAPDADTHFTGARIDKDDASKLTFYADVTLKCENGSTTLASVAVENVQIAADGTFSGTTPHQAAGPRGSEGGDLTFTGRLTSDTRIDGTIAATSTVDLKNKPPYDCVVPESAYTMFDKANDPHSAPLTPGGIYAGTSAEDFSALARLNAAGTGFTKAAIQGNLQCRNNKNGLFHFNIMPGRFIKLRADGTFSGTERFNTNRAYIKPAFTRAKWTLTGRFADGQLTGTHKAVLKVFKNKKSKQRIDTCTATIPFRVALV
jgi:hypothetical protein